MTTQMKLILTYVGGILTGIILTFIVFLCVTNSMIKKLPARTEPPVQQTTEAEQPVAQVEPFDGITLFNEPLEEMRAAHMTVDRVVDKGNAIVRVFDGTKDIFGNEADRIGKEAVLLAKEGKTYYDQQEINVPYSKKVMVIGTYKNDIETLPVIDIMDK